MLVSSDELILPETDEEVYVQQIKLDFLEDYVLNDLKKYIKSKKFAYWVKLTKIQIVDKNMNIVDKEHFCFIIKPNEKFKYEKHAQELFDIFSKYLSIHKELEDFVDFSVIGYSNTFQFDFNSDLCIEL